MKRSSGRRSCSARNSPERCRQRRRARSSTDGRARRHFHLRDRSATRMPDGDRGDPQLPLAVPLATHRALSNGCEVRAPVDLLGPGSGLAANVPLVSVLPEPMDAGGRESRRITYRGGSLLGFSAIPVSPLSSRSRWQRDSPVDGYPVRCRPGAGSTRTGAQVQRGHVQVSPRRHDPERTSRLLLSGLDRHYFQRFSDV